MKASIEFQIGERTCEVEPALVLRLRARRLETCEGISDEELVNVCRWYGIARFGTRAVCLLFDDEHLFFDNGGTQRCKECMDQFPPQVDVNQHDV